MNKSWDISEYQLKSSSWTQPQRHDWALAQTKPGISLTAFPPLSVIHSDNISVTTWIMPAHCSCVLIPDNVIIVLDINASELSVFSGHVKLSELHIF